MNRIKPSRQIQAKEEFDGNFNEAVKQARMAIQLVREGKTHEYTELRRENGRVYTKEIAGEDKINESNSNNLCVKCKNSLNHE